MSALKLCSYLIICMSFLTQAVLADPLPSWSDGKIKRDLIQWVEKVTDKSSRHYVEPAKRIATFDNDGTLWVEKPIYVQLLFAIDRIKEMAPQHPEWKHQQPFSAIIQNDKQIFEQLSLDDLKKIVEVSHTGLSVEKYHQMATNWFKTAENKRYHHLYKKVIYQPMLEVIQYLKSKEFKVYIVTGGGQEFVRAFANDAYGIPPENIIGTMGETKYSYVNNKPELIKTAELLLLDDKRGKPEAINYFIGRKPLIAFGNSDGDQQMLEWTQSGNGPHFMVLIHHDDARREYAYDSKSKIGRFSDALKKHALENNWQIVSMKKDWNRLFPFD